jgi:phage terminase small subunit
MGGLGSGRRAIPTLLKVVRGTYRPDWDGPRHMTPVTPRPSVPRAPRHFTARTSKIWRATCKEWELDAAGLAVLRVALEALDRLEQARVIVAREGLVIKTSRGTSRPHPALRVEREARAGFLMAMQRLGLEANAS